MLKKSEDGKIRVLSLSYGKDSIATIRACELLGYPIDRIITADVWATQDIPADRPPMWEFKKKADEIIFDRWGIQVEHLCAMQKDRSQNVNVERGSPRKLSYEDYFYGKRERGKTAGRTIGFPMQNRSWCNKLKTEKIDIRGHILQSLHAEEAKGMVSAWNSNTRFSEKPRSRGAEKNIVIQYLGIAADETNRISRHSVKPNIVLPLVDIGWDEALCGLEAKYMGLLAPTYETGTRDGCWFCHNQSIDQLRQLRHDYPDLWALLLKWDSDSPVTFHADGTMVHDFEKRFSLEDEGIIVPYETFRWYNVQYPQLRLF